MGKGNVIKDLEVGTYVNNEDLIFKVARCIHKTKYYAFCGHISSEHLLKINNMTQKDVDNAVETTDITADLIPCCM